MNGRIFQYGAAQVQALAAADPALGAAMARIGPIRRSVFPDLYEELVRTIVGQQISGKAQETVMGRMFAALGEITPKSLLRFSVAELQALGMSFRKATYIREATEQIADGELNLEALRSLPDEAVCEQLIRLRGVGRWTAEMLLLFSLERPDVISYDDLGISRGMRMLYQIEKVDRSLFEAYRKRYAPHASVASLYLWAISAGALPELADPAAKAI